jgi:hypothetical protein
VDNQDQEDMYKEPHESQKIGAEPQKFEEREPKAEIDPKVWGRGIWNSIHQISMETPESPAGLLKKLCTSMENCQHCQEKKKNDAALREWTLQVHNAVNRRLGKGEVKA